MLVKSAQVPASVTAESARELMVNHTVQVSMEIIADELDYFFQEKLKLVEFFVDSLDLKSYDSLVVQKRFEKLFYSCADIDRLIIRIGKLLSREAEILPSKGVAESMIGNASFLKKEGISGIDITENLRTLSCCTSIEKILGVVWLKVCQQVVPGKFIKFCGKINAVDYLLGQVGINSKSTKTKIKAALTKSIQGMIKQDRNELMDMLTQSLIHQFYTNDGLVDTSMVLREHRTA